MYATCLFCHAALGSNETIERFPVGRRLAFDTEKGRLWVVCRACGRWNLTPVEERWEAIEDCERRFRATRLRASTDQIGLARLPEGLALIRVGRPLRPEFSAWRYGDQLGQRRKRQLVVVSLGLAGLGLVVAGEAAMGMAVTSTGALLVMIGKSIVYGRPHKVVARLPRHFGTERFLVRRSHLEEIRFETADFGEPGWGLLVGPSRLSGDAAAQALTQLLPAINRFGGTRSQVRDAVGLLEAHPTPADYVKTTVATTLRRRHAASHMAAQPATKGPLDLSAHERLALEMALHEESEHRAMEGELTALRAAWREAEEVAAIADNMFLPESVLAWMRQHRRA